MPGGGTGSANLTPKTNGGRTKRAGAQRGEPTRQGRAEDGVEPATRRHTQTTWLVTKSTMPLYGRGRRRKGSQTAKSERRANKTPENTRRRAKPTTAGSGPSRGPPDTRNPAFCRNSSEIQKFDEFSTGSREFGEIPRKFHQNRCKIR